MSQIALPEQSRSLFGLAFAVAARMIHPTRPCGAASCPSKSYPHTPPLGASYRPSLGQLVARGATPEEAVQNLLYMMKDERDIEALNLIIHKGTRK